MLLSSIPVGSPSIAGAESDVDMSPGTETETVAAPRRRPQILEVERCLRAGQPESPLAPLADSVWVLEVLEAARSALGVS